MTRPAIAVLNKPVVVLHRSPYATYCFGGSWSTYGRSQPFVFQVPHVLNYGEDQLHVWFADSGELKDWRGSIDP